MLTTLTQLYANIFQLRVKIAEARESSRTAAAAAEYERQLTEAQQQLDAVIADSAEQY